jgi:hypothetical protein
MAGSQIISAQRECFIKQDAKLYVLVAGNARIGSLSLLVCPTEVVNYTGLEFLLQVKLMVGNAQNAADILRPLCLMVKAGTIPEAICMPITS